MVKTSIENFRFEAILGIVGVVTLLSFFFPWAKGSDVFYHGFENQLGVLTFIGAWLMIVGSTISYDVFNSRTLEGMKPLSDSGLGAAGGILGSAGVSAFLIDMPSMFSPTWGAYIAIACGVIGIFSAFMLYWEGKGTERAGRPRGGL